jgi:tetratricopeptide (TPR) repeat protein
MSRIVQYLQTFTTWEPSLIEMKQRLLGRELQPEERPRRLIAPIASGMAVQGNNPFPQLLEHNRKAVFLDQEVAAFYQTLHEFPDVSFLAVKCVCDYADPTKNDDYHEYAARASAVYLLHFIQEYVTDETISRRASDRAGQSGVWNVPYLRNPHFTGRDELLDRLHQQLSSEAQDAPTTTRRAALTQPQAIKGLGGIGKTQIAVEYAYRSREQGRYIHTLWVNAASEEAIIASFVTLAELLPAFPSKKKTDQQKLVAEIKRWLEQCKQHWLLIFDNADDVSIIQEDLPQRGNGSILLTTRANAVGSLATPVEVETMSFIEGTHLLLRRAQRFEHASDEEINEVGNIVVALDHFPLALDQAGAYIEETKCRFVDYLKAYQNHRRALLARRGTQATNYPDSVATTWSLSFQKVEQANPAAAELLRLCAFLAPDSIPEELIREGSMYWTPLLQSVATDLFAFNQMIAELLRFSLVKRLAEDHMLSIHRLVQVVQMDRMEQKEHRRWAERIVRAVNAVFPRNPKEEVATWPQCLRYLEQAQACYILIQCHMLMLTEAADLLNRTGTYLCEHALYTIADPLYERALWIREQQLGSEHPDVAHSLNDLATLCSKQGKYIEAELLYERALWIREQQLGSEHPDVAHSLNDLAILYSKQGKHKEAEPLLQRALRIWEQQLGSEHPDVASPLNNLAELYRDQGQYAEAEPLYQRALRIWEQQLGPEHPLVAASLNNLAILYWRRGKYAEAEPLHKRALGVLEQQLGPEHPDVAASLNNLAILYKEQGKYAEAEPLYQRALRIREQRLGSEHPDVATSLNNLANTYKEQGKYAEAEPLYQRALRIREQRLGSEHPDVASPLNNLAELYREQGKYAEAEPLFQRALRIREQRLGPEHPLVASPLHGLANIYREQGKYAEAEPLFQQSLHIREQSLGPHHQLTAQIMNDLALLREVEGNSEEAKAWYTRALAVYEQAFGAHHPKTTETRKRFIVLLDAIGQHEETQPKQGTSEEVRMAHPEQAKTVDRGPTN